MIAYNAERKGSKDRVLSSIPKTKQEMISEERYYRLEISGVP